jgi:hypothetical protein
MDSNQDYYYCSLILRFEPDGDVKKLLEGLRRRGFPPLYFNLAGRAARFLLAIAALFLLNAKSTQINLGGDRDGEGGGKGRIAMAIASEGCEWEIQSNPIRIPMGCHAAAAAQGTTEADADEEKEGTRRDATASFPFSFACLSHRLSYKTGLARPSY